MEQPKTATPLGGWMSEQRKTERAPLDVFVNKYVGGVPYMNRARDIGQDGVRLGRLIEPTQAGRRVGLQFQLPGSEEVIYAEGEVVREWLETERRHGHGVRFTLLTERHRRMIQSYVEGFGND
jgi:hypothetical protein